MSATILYGLANCSSCKDASAWLDAKGIAYSFHDFRKQGLAAERLDRWLHELGWEVLLNRRGTTWRSLPDSHRIGLDASKARKLMLSYPSLIKRPVLEVGAAVVVGFSRSKYDVVFEGAD